MGKAKRRKSVRAFAIDAELPTPEQLKQAPHERDFVTHAETNTKAMAFRNRGGTPLCRWVASNKLDDTQMAVIARCLEIWRLVGTRQSLTAKYGERLDQSSDYDGLSARAAEAEDDLKSFQSHFPGKAKDYFGIFENVIRFNMPAGVAGGDPDKKIASTRTLTIVRFVCDIIASNERQFRV
jgi:hypothetical protein